ncbi:two-partner secretion domain-containing protein [Pseudacidovorax sp. NFM-22]|uniref:two-partner secretion domain-containing protein n=1 Tax=Pseudacidovorax sp. NFM-22 TaxID=2744469 RepID=UPI001F302F3A|nr:filamentous hemagglutinin N-terminal domain-containing protein [Pseudacidovorax sp. NFM-22]
MNKNFHRVIFNAMRGQRMVVQETATSTGKGRNGASAGTGEGQRPWVLRGVVAALALIGWLPVVHAQIVPNPLALPSQRPQTLVAPNGVPLVNITTPSAGGVSVNHYSQFDVGAPGAILNNSRTPVQSQLGGYIQGNPWLATGPARVIVNQVASSNPSYLNGYVEVAGQRAEVIIANLALQGSSIDVSHSTTSASNVSLAATSGNVDTSAAKVVTPGTLTITADANAAQSLVNTGGTLNAGQLQINAANISNTVGGQLVQTGTAATTIAVSGTLDNSGSVIAANSQERGQQQPVQQWTERKSVHPAVVCGFGGYRERQRGGRQGQWGDDQPEHAIGAEGGRRRLRREREGGHDPQRWGDREHPGSH